MRINNILNAISDKLIDAYRWLAGFLMNITLDIVDSAVYRWTIRTLRVSLWMLLVSIILLVISFIGKWPLFGTLAGGFAMSACLILWRVPTTVLKIVDVSAGSIPILGKTVREISGGIKSFIKPLLDISLIIGFISLFATLYDIYGYNQKILIIAFAATLFFISFAWLSIKVVFPWRGCMVTLVVIGLVYQGLAQIFPAPVKKMTYSSVNTVNAWVFGADEMVTILPGTMFYGEHLEFTGKTDTAIVAKVLDIISDDVNEEMYKVLLPVADHQYRGGKIAWIEVRSTVRGDQKTMQIPQPKIQQVSYNPQEEVQNNVETIVISPGTPKGSRLDFGDGEYFEVLQVSGEVRYAAYSKVQSSTNEMKPLVVGDIIKIHLQKKGDHGEDINSGPVFFFSKTGGFIKIKKY